MKLFKKKISQKKNLKLNQNSLTNKFYLRNKAKTDRIKVTNDEWLNDYICERNKKNKYNICG